MLNPLMRGLYDDAADIIFTNMGMFQSDDFLGDGKDVVFGAL